MPPPVQVFVGSAAGRDGIEEVKAWAVSRLPEGPTLYPKVRSVGRRCPSGDKDRGWAQDHLLRRC